MKKFGEKSEIWLDQWLKMQTIMMKNIWRVNLI